MKQKGLKTKKLLKEKVFEGIASLTQRELRVLSLRCGLENGKMMSYQDVATKLHISPQGVHYFVKKALRKMFYQRFSKNAEFVSRNKILTKTKDDNASMSFAELGKIFGIDRGTAHKIYLREKRKKKENPVVPFDDF